jgi:hypothetical protein
MLEPLAAARRSAESAATQRAFRCYGVAHSAIRSGSAGATNAHGDVSSILEAVWIS